VVSVPSARVLLQCLAQPERPFGTGLLLGVADERTPRVAHEIASLERLFPNSSVLLDERATLAALRARASSADVIHLACHGQFRPDNPLFSALKLGHGWLTVRDVYELDLRGALVTLSACETGISAGAPGEELIGLVLLVSLWTVGDTATAELMADVYTRLQAGDTPATALRCAQLRQMQTRPHPYFWSPFALLGRW
jgi:CHAT domain-containing protein